MLDSCLESAKRICYMNIEALILVNVLQIFYIDDTLANDVFLKNLLQSSIIVHRELTLICLLYMPLWLLTGANEEEHNR